MAERHGKNSRVILDGVTIKCTTFDLNMAQDTVEVTGFGDSNKRYVLGHKDFQGTFSGFWDDSVDKLFDVTDAGAAINGYFYPDAVNAPTQYWWGSVLVDASVSTGVSAAVGFTGNVVAFGAITRSGLP